jgi:hypothetical protein
MFFLQNMKNHGTQFDTKPRKVLKGQIEKGIEQILNGGGRGYLVSPMAYHM